ncbi:MAG: aminoacyl-tRNA deacylase [Verrucomicrobiota bacterium]
MIAEQVAEVLESAGVEFEALAHRRTETAGEEARSLGIAPDAVAKTVVLGTPEGHVRAVLLASERLDLRKVRTVLGLTAKEVSLLGEEELAQHYPEFELGAVPPFGGRADRVLVDRRVVDHERVVLEAGTHDTSLRLRTSDLLNLTGAQVLDLCQD